jgi:hypothetical protein
VQERVLLHLHEILIDGQFHDTGLSNPTRRVVPQNVEELFVDGQGHVLVVLVRQQALVQQPNVQRQHRVAGAKVPSDAARTEPATAQVVCVCSARPKIKNAEKK